MARKTVEAYGGEYESLVELSREFGVDYQEMGILIRKGLTPEEAIERCRGRQQGKEDALYIINSISYCSLSEACRGLGVSPGSVYARRKKLIGDVELPEDEVIRITQGVLNQLATEQIKHRSRGSSGVSVAGKVYPSCQAALAAYHLSPATVNARMARAKQAGRELSFEEAVLLGRNKQYAAVEYGSELLELKSAQAELLEYLRGELEGEFFKVAVEENRLVADRHLVDDARPISLEISWVAARLLSVRWLEFADGELDINKLNARYAGIKLCAQDSKVVEAVCDTFVEGCGIASRRAAMAAVRQLLETGNLILAQAGE